ncbi:MAG: hypothetical protein ACRCWR_05420 [Saezia sp.]
MKKFLLLLLSPFFLISTPSSAQERAFDHFVGMLESRHGELIFVRCGHKSSPMRVHFVEDYDEESINQAYAAMKDHRLVQVASIADVVANDNDTKYPYDIFVKEFISMATDESCHLDDYLAASIKGMRAKQNFSRSSQ